MDAVSKIGEERITVEESNCLLQTPPQTRPAKKFRKTSSSNYDYMESVPSDVIFEILVRVTAQEIHNSARLVCRKWHNIVNTRDFKRAHLHRSPCGLVAHRVDFSSGHQHMTFIASVSKGDDDLSIEISKLRYRPQHVVLSSCNGLILETRRNNTRYFYITNPITEQKLDLPPFSSYGKPLYGSAIAYVPTTMEYKVVRSFIRRDCKPQDHCVDIYTVGVDKDWTRLVKTQHLSLQSKELLKNLHPLTTQGFVHWVPDERVLNCVLTLNVETEIITKFPVPSSRRRGFGFCSDQAIYLPMGSYLSLLICRSKHLWELWEMNPETGEWTEMPSIDLKAQLVSSTDYELFEPVGWLRPREVLVFSATNYFGCPIHFAFTVRTHKLQKFILDGVANRYHVHRNSLEWIHGY